MDSSSSSVEIGQETHRTNSSSQNGVDISTGKSKTNRKLVMAPTTSDGESEEEEEDEIHRLQKIVQDQAKQLSEEKTTSRKVN